MTVPTKASSSAYEQDFHAWAMENAALLRAHRFTEIDMENITEELEGMARSERRELVNRLAVLLADLLKWIVQKEQREYQANSSRATIRGQRRQVNLLLSDSPSLSSLLPQAFAAAYASAIDKAVAETNLPDRAFPAQLPFTLEQALDPTYWPD